MSHSHKKNIFWVCTHMEPIRTFLWYPRGLCSSMKCIALHKVINPLMVTWKILTTNQHPTPNQRPTPPTHPSMVLSTSLRQHNTFIYDYNNLIFIYHIHTSTNSPPSTYTLTEYLASHYSTPTITHIPSVTPKLSTQIITWKWCCWQTCQHNGVHVLPSTTPDTHTTIIHKQKIPLIYNQ